MINKLRMFLLLAALGMVFCCATSGLAQKVGGYKEIPTTDAGAVAAANFGVSARAKKTGGTAELVAIEQVESQVVAGTNFRLCLKVTTSGAANEADATELFKVVVYRNLKNVFSLTSWVREECGEDE
jgi:Cystatin domain